MSKVSEHVYKLEFYFIFSFLTNCLTPSRPLFVTHLPTAHSGIHMSVKQYVLPFPAPLFNSSRYTQLPAFRTLNTELFTYIYVLPFVQPLMPAAADGVRTILKQEGLAGKNYGTTLCQ